MLGRIRLGFVLGGVALALAVGAPLVSAPVVRATPAVAARSVAGPCLQSTAQCSGGSPVPTGPAAAALAPLIVLAALGVAVPPAWSRRRLRAAPLRLPAGCPLGVTRPPRTELHTF